MTLFVYTHVFIQQVMFCVTGTILGTGDISESRNCAKNKIRKVILFSLHLILVEYTPAMNFVYHWVVLTY